MLIAISITIMYSYDWCVYSWFVVHHNALLWLTLWNSMLILRSSGDGIYNVEVACLSCLSGILGLRTFPPGVTKMLLVLFLSELFVPLTRDDFQKSPSGKQRYGPAACPGMDWTVPFSSQILWPSDSIHNVTWWHGHLEFSLRHSVFECPLQLADFCYSMCLRVAWLFTEENSQSRAGASEAHCGSVCSWGEEASGCPSATPCRWGHRSFNRCGHSRWN